jgi:hypothetical protein
VEINKYEIFTADHFHNVCAATRDKVSASSLPTLVHTLSPECLKPVSGDIHTPCLHLDQFRPAIHTPYELGEGMKMSDADMLSDDDNMQVLSRVEEPGIPRSADSYAPGTRPGTKWQKRQLLKLEFWSKLLIAERNMMDVMLADNMFDQAILPSGLV